MLDFRKIVNTNCALIVHNRTYSLTWQYPGVLVLLLVAPDCAVPDRVDHLLVADGAVELELEQHRVLPPLRAVVLELGDGHGAVVKLLRHPVPLGCKMEERRFN